MPHQRGFTLIELMVVIAIIAILSSISIPLYQGYTQKAALIDMLQMMTGYKTSIELCALDQENFTGCQLGARGIALSQTSRYVEKVEVANGIIKLYGKRNLAGLTVTMTPQRNKDSGHTIWKHLCETQSVSLLAACNEVFHFN